jgi:hypothetical protein
MSRKVAVSWHASFSIAAGVLYFFFVLPRWPELTGETGHGLGTAMRIVAGALIGLAALPVVFTLLRTRKPELGTPQLALSLRTSSIALQVVAGVLIIGTAISETWLSLDNFGRWLFGIYGAAAAIALLGIAAFYLAYVAELPPPPPKPLKPKKEKKRRGRRRGKGDEADETSTDAESAEETEEAAAEDAETKSDDGDAPPEAEESTESEDKPAEVTAEPADESADGTAEEAASQESASDEVNGAEKANGRLRNRRSPGKMSLRKRRRSRGGVAVED